MGRMASRPGILAAQVIVVSDAWQQEEQENPSSNTRTHCHFSLEPQE